MTKKREYRITGIRPNSAPVMSLRLGSPTEGVMCAWGKQRGCGFVIRYWPKYEGWGALDIRKATHRRASRFAPGFWIGCIKPKRFFPNEDAAVMWAIHELARQPELSLGN